MKRVWTIGDLSTLELMRELVRLDFAPHEVILLEHVERLASRRLLEGASFAVPTTPTVAGERASLVILDERANFAQPIMPTLKIATDAPPANRHERRAAEARRRRKKPNA